MYNSLFMHYASAYHLCHAKTENFIYRSMHASIARHKRMAKWWRI